MRNKASDELKFAPDLINFCCFDFHSHFLASISFLIYIGKDMSFPAFRQKRFFFLFNKAGAHIQYVCNTYAVTGVNYTNLSFCSSLSLQVGKGRNLV